MKRGIRILQDHLRGGGTERQSIELTRALIANGWEAQLIVGKAASRAAGTSNARQSPFCGSPTVRSAACVHCNICASILLKNRP